MIGDVTSGSSVRWQPTRAFGRVIVVVGLLLLLAVFTRRPDLVVFAAPFAIGTALGLWRRPTGGPEAHLTLAEPSLPEGGVVRAGIDVTNHDRIRYDLVIIRMTTDRWVRMRYDERPYATGLAGERNIGVDLNGRALRWGRHLVGPVMIHAVVADGLMVSAPLDAPAADLTVYPMTEAFRANDAMPRAAGVIGFHRSRRPGEGGELAGVRLFGPGDRLRRIDWRVSLRTRQLHVAATLSDRDAEVVVLLDVLHEVGRSGGIGGTRSVLDTTVRAAAGIGDYYLHHGDRVSFMEYGWQSRRLRPSSGHRHYLTALEWLLDVVPSPVDGDMPASVFGAQTISPNALIVVLTPLVDPRSAAMLARFARAGRFVVAIDTMPPHLLDALGAVVPRRRGDAGTGALPWLTGTGYNAPAARLWRLERENTLGRLREHGVPVVTWRGPGSLDEVLQQVSRMSTSPHAAVRV